MQIRIQYGCKQVHVSFQIKENLLKMFDVTYLLWTTRNLSIPLWTGAHPLSFLHPIPIHNYEQQDFQLRTNFWYGPSPLHQLFCEIFHPGNTNRE